MAIYTGIADANGDFTVPFPSNYTGGQKITVTAEKDSATKSIELFAPSDVTGGGVIQFGGTLDNFPLNIGVVTISGISGKIGDYAFQAAANALGVWKKATGLVIGAGVTEIGNYAFDSWYGIKSLSLPEGLTKIGNNAFFSASLIESVVIPSSVTSIGSYSFYALSSALSLSLSGSIIAIPEYAFYGWTKATTLSIPEGVVSVGIHSFSGWSKGKYLTLPQSLSSINALAFANWVECVEITCLRATPPTLASGGFQSLNAACVIKVPLASLAAYKTDANWSAFAAQMVGV